MQIKCGFRQCDWPIFCALSQQLYASRSGHHHGLQSDLMTFVRQSTCSVCHTCTCFNWRSAIALSWWLSNVYGRPVVVLSSGRIVRISLLWFLRRNIYTFATSLIKAATRCSPQRLRRSLQRVVYSRNGGDRCAALLTSSAPMRCRLKRSNCYYRHRYLQ